MFPGGELERFLGQLYDVRAVRGNQSRVFWVRQHADSADSIAPSYEASMMLDHSERALHPAAVPATGLVESWGNEPCPAAQRVMQLSAFATDGLQANR